MKKYLVIFLLLFSAPCLAANIVEVVGDNGVKAWLAEDHSSPIIALEISFKSCGSAYDPADKQGLSTVVSSMLDEGAGDLDSTHFQRALEDNAVRFAADSDYDNFHITLKTLTKNREKALQLLQLAITKPRFEKTALSRIKSQITALIKKSEASPGYMANQKFHEIFFAGHPYAEKPYGDEKSLALITSKDLADFAARNFSKNRIVISAAGDITPAEFKAILDQYFSGLKDGGAIAEIPEFTNYPKASELEKISFQLPQSYAEFGLKGLKRNDPDYYKAYVLNYIVGGGEFESRLMREVREKRGLAYSVSTELEPYFHAGLLSGSLSTRKEKIDESLAVVKNELANIAKNGVTDAEVEGAKKNLLISFPLNLDSNARLAGFMDVMQLFDLGIDYIDKRQQYIGGVTKAEVNQVARSLLEQNMLTIEAGQ